MSVCLFLQRIIISLIWVMAWWEVFTFINILKYLTFPKDWETKNVTLDTRSMIKCLFWHSLPFDKGKKIKKKDFTILAPLFINHLSSYGNWISILKVENIFLKKSSNFDLSGMNALFKRNEQEIKNTHNTPTKTLY